MLVATFGPTTAWVGKTVTYMDGSFVLEGHGRIGARDLFDYERQGQLVWSMDGVRAWVGAKAQAEGGWTAASLQASDWQADAAIVEPRDAEPVPIAGAADPVLAAEPADLARIAEASARVSGVDVHESPAEPQLGADPVAEAASSPATSAKDAFAGLGADDPARARAIETAAREHDWARLAALYLLQAWWLDEEGRDALQVTRLARRAELRSLAERGAAQVLVKAADGDTCAACRRLGGRVMTIADALRLMPIPDASCEYKWCRCSWEPAD
jgi:hypothetical protein